MSDRGHGCDRRGAALLSTGIPSVPQHGVELLDKSRDRRERQGADRGELHLPRRPVDKAHAELPLDMTNTKADRAL
jgi:hypothetical protein